MDVALHQIFIIFTALAAGFFCAKAKIITEEGTSVLSSIVVKIILPFYLFNAIAASDSGVDSSGVLTAVFLSTAMFILCAVIGIIFCPAVKAPKNDRGVYIFEITFGCVTYIGIPLCEAVLGSKAAFYSALLNIPFNLLCFSVGIILLSGKISLKMIFNPAFLSGLVAVILYVLKIPVPSIVSDACKFIGQATSPCAMLLIGSVLASVPFKSIFSQWRAVPYVLFRLFIIPLVIFLLTSFIQIDSTLRFVLVIMSAMPAATNSTMLCTIYGGNRELSAKLIFLSTALSIISLPLWVTFLMNHI